MSRRLALHGRFDAGHRVSVSWTDASLGVSWPGAVSLWSRSRQRQATDCMNPWSRARQEIQVGGCRGFEMYRSEPEGPGISPPKESSREFRERRSQFALRRLVSAVAESYAYWLSLEGFR